MSTPGGKRHRGQRLASPKCVPYGELPLVQYFTHIRTELLPAHQTASIASAMARDKRAAQWTHVFHQEPAVALLGIAVFGACAQPTETQRGFGRATARCAARPRRHERVLPLTKN